MISFFISSGCSLSCARYICRIQFVKFNSPFFEPARRWAGKRRTIPQSCLDCRKWRDSCRSSTNTSRESKRYWMAKWKMSSAAHRWRADKFPMWCSKCDRTLASHDESRAIWLMVGRETANYSSVFTANRDLCGARNIEKRLMLLIGSHLWCGIACTRRVRSWLWVAINPKPQMSQSFLKLKLSKDFHVLLRLLSNFSSLVSKRLKIFKSSLAHLSKWKAAISALCRS